MLAVDPVDGGARPVTGLPGSVALAARLLAFGPGGLECLLGFGNIRLSEVETAFGRRHPGLNAGQFVLSHREPGAKFGKPALRVAAGTCPVDHEEIMSTARKD